MKNLDKEVNVFLSKLDLSGKNVVCGFSGGADSTALLYILSKKQKKFGFNLSSVFFNHGNSPIAENEPLMEKFCSDFCKKYEIPFSIVPLSDKKFLGQGWESTGRIGRKGFFNDSDYDFVFLGHHSDDQDETTMIQFMRGCGLGASGMVDFDGFFCRPFLNIEKTDIYDFLWENNVGWIEDPTNKNSDFTRNFWRNEGLPLIKKHYPYYKKSLKNFRKYNLELNTLAFDLAVEDGLYDLKNTGKLNFSKIKDSDLRIKNLLITFLSSSGKKIEDKLLEQKIKDFRANNFVVFSHKNLEITIKDNNIFVVGLDLLVQNKGSLKNVL